MKSGLRPTAKHLVSLAYWPKRKRSSRALVLTIMLGAALVCSSAGQTLTVLHKFNGPDGDTPITGVIRDGAGNVYGTTKWGGSAGSGTVFKVETSLNEILLHDFTGTTEAATPRGNLILDSAGNLYGAASGGGDSACQCGVIFRIDRRGKWTVLYSFKGGQDGYSPGAGVILDGAGNLYGTTYSGGHTYGTVFKLDASGKETMLYRFRGGLDGSAPTGELVRDAAGNLYGTTSAGGDSICQCGTIFKLDSTGKETVLYRFLGGTDGSGSAAGLVRDAAGNLYGMTTGGGDPICQCGVVFKLDKSGKETVLHSFTHGSDGAYPYGGVIRDAAGNLYGTTNYGGDSDAGIIFKLDSSGGETILYSFRGQGDGGYPYAGVIRDSAGNLYGTTAFDDDGNCFCGTVWELTP